MLCNHRHIFADDADILEDILTGDRAVPSHQVSAAVTSPVTVPVTSPVTVPVKTEVCEK